MAAQAARRSWNVTIHRLSTLVVLGLTLGAIALDGCGSSKPAYCTQVSEVKNAVQELPGSVSSGPNAVVAAVQKVETSLKALQTSAKSELAPQTSALKSSLEALEKTIKNLASASSSQAREQALAGIPSQVGAVQSAATNLVSAAKACQ